VEGANQNLERGDGFVRSKYPIKYDIDDPLRQETDEFLRSKRDEEFLRRAIDRFWSKTHGAAHGCIVWDGQLVNGYGSFVFRHKTYRAHRWIYEQTYGPIQNGLFCCHKCDRPSCVNPEHIFLGTHADNMRDMYEKRAARKLATLPKALTRTEVEPVPVIVRKPVEVVTTSNTQTQSYRRLWREILAVDRGEVRRRIRGSHGRRA
jgi:hypothetical protein